MLNIEKYKDEILERLDGDDLGYAISTIFYIYSKDEHKAYEKDAFEWLCEEYKEPILTDEEREYLKFVLKPFHKRIEFITKEDEGSEKETISFVYDTEYESWLPSFPKGTMYKNLRSYDCYTLEELGITYDD